MDEPSMQISIFTPARRILDLEAVSLQAEGLDGMFGILPRHIDVAAPLVPCIMVLRRPDGREKFVAVDQGCLLKLRTSVRIATRRAVVGEDLEHLATIVDRDFRRVSEHELDVRRALVRLETTFARRLLSIERS